jgi:hypothetical protein
VEEHQHKNYNGRFFHGNQFKKIIAQQAEDAPWNKLRSTFISHDIFCRLHSTIFVD